MHPQVAKRNQKAIVELLLELHFFRHMKQAEFVDFRYEAPLLPAMQSFGTLPVFSDGFFV